MPDLRSIIEGARVKAEIFADERNQRIADRDATLELAGAIRDLAGAIRDYTTAMFPQPEPELTYRCEECGSPKWEPGGMASAFKQCVDCKHIGDKIENES